MALLFYLLLLYPFPFDFFPFVLFFSFLPAEAKDVFRQQKPQVAGFPFRRRRRRRRPAALRQKIDQHQTAR